MHVETPFLRALGATLLVSSLLSPGVWCASPAAGLRSADPLERQRAFDGVLGARSADVVELISILEEPGIDRSYQGPLHRAVVLLGELRADEAIDPLARLLLYVPPGFEMEERIPDAAWHVAAVALARIGTPALGRMVSIIRTSHDADERRVAAWVILEMAGQEFATEYLGHMAERVPSGQGNLRAAQSYVQHYRPSFERER